MTYIEREISYEDGEPFELYRFTYGDYHYFYTSAPQPVTINGYLYRSESLIRSTISTSSVWDNPSDFTLTLPINSKLTQNLHEYSDSNQGDIEVIIYRLHWDDDLRNGIKDFKEGDYHIIMKGKITKFSFKQNKVILSIARIFENINSRKLPPFTWSESCNHTLYDILCGVDKTKYTNSFPIYSFDDNTIDIYADWRGKSYRFFQEIERALVTVKTQKRELISATPGSYWQNRNNPADFIWANSDFPQAAPHTKRQITLLFGTPFTNLVRGNDLDITLACDYSLATCNSRFNNTYKFGGFPYIPVENPFEVRGN